MMHVLIRLCNKLVSWTQLAAHWAAQNRSQSSQYTPQSCEMATALPVSGIPEAEHLFKKAVEGIASQLQTNEGEAASLPLLFDAVCNNSSAATQSFCRELVETISASVATVSAYSRQRAREKALSHFHQLRINTLPGIWRRMEAKLSLFPTKAAMAQSVNRC